ncbi:PspC domain-containing protein [Sunxiuqinia sp. A32]|uniref:PspC domain-containing protein n=1 Tax=Sunxiuqinia sp. A32 TaxID=3461496 RepID=UPI00404521FB
MTVKKRITRSNDKIIAGVLGGFANYFDIDPVLIRVIFVVLSIFSAGFPGLLIYLILWIAIPKEN